MKPHQLDFAQRWRSRRASYRPTGEVIDTRAYEVAALAGRARRPPGLMHLAVVVGLCGSVLAIGSKFALNLVDPMLLLFLSAAMAILIGVPIVRAARSSRKLRAGSSGRLGPAAWAWWSLAPVLGVASAWAAWSGVAREWRWRFDEPRFRSEAVRALSNPPPAGSVSTTRHIGTVGVRQISVVNGRVHFLTTQDDFIHTVELIYSPPGTPPPLGGAGLGGGWAFELRDPY